MKRELVNFYSGFNEKVKKHKYNMYKNNQSMHFIYYTFVVLIKIVVCPSRVPLTEHSLLRIRATNTLRLANMSRRSSATQKQSAYVPKNRKEICPPSTRIELQPTSNRFVSVRLSFVVSHSKCYMSE